MIVCMDQMSRWIERKTMDDFKAGRLQILVASDLAARGLDIEGITHIINVIFPRDQWSTFIERVEQVEMVNRNDEYQ